LKMKDKILLDIYLPAIEKSMEVRISRQMKVAQATEMLVDFLKRQDVEYIPNEESCLYDAETGKIFECNAFIENLGLHNGSKIMLI